MHHDSDGVAGKTGSEQRQKRVPIMDGLLNVGVGVALFAIIETEKQLRLRLRQLKGT